MSRTLTEHLAVATVETFSLAVAGFLGRYMRNCARWHIRGPLDALLQSGEQKIIAGWHQDAIPLLVYMGIYAHMERTFRPLMLASRSFDGELTERALRRYGFGFVRGSRGKSGGRAALHGMLDALRGGRDVLVIADGPRPPPYEFKPGPIFLAKKTGVPLYVVRVWTRPHFLLHSTWFKMAFPAPRCHVAAFSAGPIDVSGSVEDARLRAEQALLRLGEEADAHLYLRKRASGGARWVERRV